MVFLSIDFAIRSSGVAILDDEKVYYYTTLKYKGPLDDTFESMRNHTAFWINELNNKVIPNIPLDKKLVVLVESLPVVGHYMTTINIAVGKTNVYHALRYHVINTPTFSPLAILPVKVKEWKSKLLEKGNADKLYTKLWVEKFYPQCPLGALNDVDALDAVAIGLYGVKFVKQSLSNNKVEVAYELDTGKT